MITTTNATTTLRTAATAAAILLSASLLALPAAAHASTQLALDKGCMNCHGNPIRQHVPNFEQLASHAAKYRDQPGADQKLADKLRGHELFGNVTGHETLTPESALTLARWIIGGAK